MLVITGESTKVWWPPDLAFCSTSFKVAIYFDQLIKVGMAKLLLKTNLIYVAMINDSVYSMPPCIHVGRIGTNG